MNLPEGLHMSAKKKVDGERRDDVFFYGTGVFWERGLSLFAVPEAFKGEMRNGNACLTICISIYNDWSLLSAISFHEEMALETELQPWELVQR